MGATLEDPDKSAPTADEVMVETVNSAEPATEAGESRDDSPVALRQSVVDIFKEDDDEEENSPEDSAAEAATAPRGIGSWFRSNRSAAKPNNNDNSIPLPASLSPAAPGASNTPLTASLHGQKATTAASPSSNDLLKEISFLRERLQDLDAESNAGTSCCGGLESPSVETASKSGVMAPSSAIATPNHSSHDVNLTAAELELKKKEVIHLKELQARQEMEFMNSLASLQVDTQATVTRLEKELTESRQDHDDRIQTADQEIASQKQTIASLMEKVQSLEVEKSALLLERDTLHGEKEEWQTIRSSLEAQNKALEAETKSLEVERELHESEQARWTAEQDEWQAANAELRLSVETLIQEKEALEQEASQVTELQSQIETLQLEQEESQKEHEAALESARQDSAELELQFQETVDEMARLQDDLYKSATDAAVAKEQVGEMNDALIELEQECQSMDAQLQEAREEISTLTSKNTELQASVRALQKDPSGTRAVDNSEAIVELRSKYQQLELSMQQKQDRIGTLEIALSEEKRRNQDGLKERERFQETTELKIRTLETKLKEEKRNNEAISLDFKSAQDEDQKELERLRQRAAELTQELQKAQQQQTAGSPNTMSKKPVPRPQQQQPAPVRRAVFRSHSSPKSRPPLEVTTTTNGAATNNLPSPPRVSRLQAWPPPSNATSATTTPPTNRRRRLPPAATSSFNGRVNTLSSTVQSSSPSPRTPVSGLVASFERRIKSKDPPPSAMSNSNYDTATTSEVTTVTDDTLESSAETMLLLDPPQPDLHHDDSIMVTTPPQGGLDQEITELRRALQQERDTVSRLERELENCRDTHAAEMREVKRAHTSVNNKSLVDLSSLRRELEQEQETVARLDRELQQSSALAVQHSQVKQDLEDRIKGLNETCQETHVEAEELRVQLTKEQDLVHTLRKEVASLSAVSTVRKVPSSSSSVASSGSTSSTSLERKLEDYRQINTQLQSQVESLDSTRKLLLRENEQLRNQLTDEEEKLTKLENDLRQKENKITQMQLDMHHRNQDSQQRIQHLEGELRKEQENAAMQMQQAKNNTNDRDDEIDRIKDELTKTQVQKGELEMGYMSRIKELEREMEALALDARERVDDAQTEIEGLQQTLKQKSIDVDRLEKERLQLCTNMNSANAHRNQEFDELQSELFERTAETTSLQREMQALQLEKDTQERTLSNKITQLEQEVERNRNLAGESLSQLKTENAQLRDSVRTLKAERRSTAAVAPTTSKSTQVLRDRNAALRSEVERLSKRLKKMEESITRFAI